jgi:outer membrane immunogenic protein
MRYPPKSAFLAILGICVLGQSALAADIPVRKAAPAPVYIPYNWNGWYVGAHLGYGWGDKEWTGTSGENGSHDFDGWLGGFQTGFNVQSGNWLWGVEGQWSWTGGNGGTTLTSGDIVDVDVDWIATLALRLGLVQDRWLGYFKVGGAWARDSISVEGFGSRSDTRSGWMLGLGVEYAWGGNWTSKLEYNYLDFRDRHFSVAGFGADVDQKAHVIKVGLNYKFDWGKTPPAPLPARY